MPAPPRLALATCSNLPDWEVDDHILHGVLAERQVAFDVVPWDAGPPVDWASYDGILIRTTWDYQERLPEFLAWLDHVEAVTRVFNPPRVVRWNVRKTYLQDLAGDGVPTIPTVWLGQPMGDPALLLALAQSLDGRAERFFLKPEVGATALGTLPFGGDLAGAAAAEGHLAGWLGRSGACAMMLQPFLPSVTAFGECSVLFVDGAPAHGVRKIPVPGDYRVQDDFGASDEPWEPPAEVLEIATMAMESAVRHTPPDDGRGRGGGSGGGGGRGGVGRGGEPLLYGRADFLRDDVAAAEGDPAGGWRIVELELVEPSLFLRHSRRTAERLADAVVQRVQVEG